MSDRRIGWRLVRCIVVLVFLALGSTTSTAQGVLLDESIPSEARSDLSAVARDVYQVVTDMFGTTPPVEHPITIFYRSSGPPITLVERSGRTPRVRIGTTVGGRQYDQFSFQLAHELSHAMLNPTRSSWLVESVATAVSLETLDRLAVRWSVRPPYANWKAYAPRFTEYRQRQQRSALAALPGEASGAPFTGQWDTARRFVRLFFVDARSDVRGVGRGDPVFAGHEMLAALLLLSEQVHWPSLVNLALCSSAPAGGSSTYVYSSPDALCALRLAPFLARLGVG